MSGIKIMASRYRNGREAVAAVEAGFCEVAIHMGSMWLGTSKDEERRLEESGTPYSVVARHKPTGRIVGIPVNHDR